MKVSSVLKKYNCILFRKIHSIWANSHTGLKITFNEKHTFKFERQLNAKFVFFIFWNKLYITKLQVVSI